jgi:hypothetical protein
MFFTLVPALIGFGEPFTGRFLMTMTESPFLSSFQLESRILRVSASADSFGFHSNPQSGHVNISSPEE